MSFEITPDKQDKVSCTGKNEGCHTQNLKEVQNGYIAGMVRESGNSNVVDRRRPYVAALSADNCKLYS